MIDGQTVDSAAKLMDKARELSRLLEDTSELKEYLSAELQMLNDDGASELRLELERQEEEVRFHGPADPGYSEALGMYLAAQAAWRERPSVKEYFRAQERLDQLLARINAVITYPITGDENPVPARGCGGCGGGCGSHQAH